MPETVQQNTKIANDQATGLWQRPGGYRDIIVLALPLVLSTSSWAIQHFIDRMFLAWHDTNAMAAAMPAGMLAFTIISFFIGTASYANTFVAQYEGAGQRRRVGPAIWQAIYFSLIAGLLLPFIGLFSDTIFGWVGHEPIIMAMESSYFKVMLLGAGFTLYGSAISCFYTGLGRSWPVFWVNILITAANLVLDYALIFGNWGFPQWGIVGAAWATVAAQGFGALLFTVLILLPRNEHQFATLSGWRPDQALFKRLMRFGIPSGVQFSLDMLALSFFAFIVGRIGTTELTATNLAFQVNSIAFMPMIGFAIATTTLVGQWLGANRPDLATRATWSAFHLTFGYMLIVATLFICMPHVFIDPFALKAAAGSFDEIRRLATVILIFVAIYSLFDTVNIIMASALKGAGDTKFVMIFSMSISWLVMVIPAWVACEVYGGGIFAAWLCLSAWVIILGVGFMIRFLRGKWRSMRVIENAPIIGSLPTNVPANPTIDVDL